MASRRWYLKWILKDGYAVNKWGQHEEYAKWKQCEQRQRGQKYRVWKGGKSGSVDSKTGYIIFPWPQPTHCPKFPLSVKSAAIYLPP